MIMFREEKIKNAIIFFLSKSKNNESDLKKVIYCLKT